MSGFVSLTPKIPVLSRGRVATSKELWNRTDIKSHTCRGPSRRDRLLTTSQETSLGARVVTPRRGYTHHGIYAGSGRVVQYHGLARGLSTGPVEEVSLAQFSRGNSVWARSEDSTCFDGDEVVHRARSRVGEDRYHLLTNNCEHFCEWCLRGEHRSYQVDAWLSRSRPVLRMTVGLIAWLLSVRETLDAKVHSRRIGLQSRGFLVWGSRTFRAESNGFSTAPR